MTNDTLLKKLQEKLENVNVPKTVIDNFFKVVESGEKIPTGLAITVASGNETLAQEIIEICNQISENKNNDDKVIKDENENNQIVEEIDNNSELRIPWEEYKTFNDFEKAYNLDHSMVLKLISDLKISSTLSIETINNILANENIKKVLYGNFVWTDSEIEKLKNAFCKEFSAFVNHIEKNEPLIENSEIFDLKQQKVKELENKKQKEKDKVVQNMAFDILKSSADELQSDLEKLYNLEIDKDLLNGLQIDFDAVSKNIVHVTQNYLSKSDITKIEEGQNIFLDANKVFNESAKYVNALKEIGNKIDVNMTELMMVLANKEDLQLSKDYEQKLDIVSNNVKEYYGTYYEQQINKNKINNFVLNGSLDEFMNALSSDTKQSILNFTSLLKEQVKNDSNKVEQLENMDLKTFIATDDVISEYNILTNLSDIFAKKVAIVNNENDAKSFELKNTLLPTNLQISENDSSKIKLPSGAVNLLANLHNKQITKYYEIYETVSTVPVDSIVDEINKIDEDVKDINDKIVNTNDEEKKKYNKLLIEKEIAKSCLLSRAFTFNPSNKEETLVVKENINSIDEVEKTEQDNITVNSTEENKSNDMKEQLNQIKTLLIELKNKGVDINKIVEQIDILDEKEKMIDNELNSKKM